MPPCDLVPQHAMHSHGLFGAWGKSGRLPGQCPSLGGREGSDEPQEGLAAGPGGEDRVGCDWVGCLAVSFLFLLAWEACGKIYVVLFEGGVQRWEPKGKVVGTSPTHLCRQLLRARARWLAEDIHSLHR